MKAVNLTIRYGYVSKGVSLRLLGRCLCGEGHGKVVHYAPLLSICPLFHSVSPFWAQEN